MLENLPFEVIVDPMLPSQLIVMTTGAQSAILNIEDTEKGKRYTMYIVEAVNQGTSGSTTPAYSVSVKSVTLPQSNYLEALLTLGGLKRS